MAYLITIHKSQGSEADIVIVVIDKSHKMNSINLLYTAVTRAKKKCILIAEEKTIEDIINGKINKRISNLAHIIKKI
jgi:exodeoxyribonuclease V alpha subunit